MPSEREKLALSELLISCVAPFGPQNLPTFPNASWEKGKINFRHRSQKAEGILRLFSKQLCDMRVIIMQYIFILLYRKLTTTRRVWKPPFTRQRSSIRWLMATYSRSKSTNWRQKCNFDWTEKEKPVANDRPYRFFADHNIMRLLTQLSSIRMIGGLYHH